MRCKVGDLCLIVRTARKHAHLIGRFTTVLAPASLHPAADWQIDVIVPGYDFVEIRDKDLLPIRDQPGTDETLTWAGLPSQIKETV